MMIDLRASVLALALVPGLLAAQGPPPGDARDGIVRAVLFFSPTCPHCHRVMEDDLPPLVERYGDRLRILQVDVSSGAGQALYLATVEHLGVGEDRYGVPAVLVGSRFLVGAGEIPAELPGIVAQGLAAGGIPWADVPALQRFIGMSERSGGEIREVPGIAVFGIAGPGGGADPPSMFQRFRMDPVANTLAVAVLALMVVAVLGAVAAVQGSGPRPAPLPGWIVPVLGLAGMAVAAYLSFVEITGAEAVCGPVGDCNTVQQSAYARLFGVVPVGVLGMAGYLAMIGAWTVGARAGGAQRRKAYLSVWVLALVGTVFSAYLTFLEPFVIGATCAWCLTSALITTLILLAATSHVVPHGRPGRRARARAAERAGV